MPINYAVKKTKNPNGIEGTEYFHGRVVKTSDYTFEELAEDINNSTTVTQADAFAVLKAMKKYIKQALLAGRRVVLSDLGALRMSIVGKVFTEDQLKDKEFIPSSKIKGINVNFRPEAKLIKELRAEAKLQRVAGEYDE
jgi:predicted histone-like DNA-binding protein